MTSVLIKEKRMNFRYVTKWTCEMKVLENTLHTFAFQALWQTRALHVFNIWMNLHQY